MPRMQGPTYRAGATQPVPEYRGLDAVHPLGPVTRVPNRARPQRCVARAVALPIRATGENARRRLRCRVEAWQVCGELVEVLVEIHGVLDAPLRRSVPCMFVTRRTSRLVGSPRCYVDPTAPAIS